MKKILLFLSFLVATVVAFAQEPYSEQELFGSSDETVVANAQNTFLSTDNHALTLNAPVVNERQMMGFMQSNSAIARDYDSYQKTAIAGWSLFSAGVVVLAAGIPLWIEGVQALDDPENKNSAGKAIGNIFGGSIIGGTGAVLTAVGAVVTTAGIVCLGVGYGMRGGKADLTYYGKQRQRVPMVRFDLQSSSNGLGIAMKF